MKTQANKIDIMGQFLNPGSSCGPPSGLFCAKMPPQRRPGMPQHASVKNKGSQLRCWGGAAAAAQAADLVIRALSGHQRRQLLWIARLMK